LFCAEKATKQLREEEAPAAFFTWFFQVSGLHHVVGIIWNFHAETVALGKQAITVMLKDVDGDGFEEMLAYREIRFVIL
jgi:hypothetical protein